MALAFVTGSESGIGSAIAKRLAREGHALVCAYHTDADAAARVVEACGAQACALACDIGSAGSVEAAFAELAQQGHHPAILVHAAGIGGPAGATADNMVADWERTLAVNLTGAFLVARSFIAAFRAGGHRRGAAIFVSSIHATRGMPGGAAYSASKAGLERLVESLALEWAGDGVAVNAVRPGMILGGMNAGLDDAARMAAEARVPLGRGGTAEEVADLVAFLVDPRAAYITGTQVTIDGGLSLIS